MIIPESSVHLNEIYSKETVNRFLQEGEEFLSRIEQIDIIGPLKTVDYRDGFFVRKKFFYFRSGLSNRSNRFRSSIQFSFKRSTFIILVQDRYFRLEIERYISHL